MSESVESHTRRLFEQFKNGEGSVRELARQNSIPFTTLRDRFRKYFGQTYRFRSGAEGSITAILKEHIASLSGEERKRVEEWWLANKQKVYESAYQALVDEAPKLFSEPKLNRDSQSLCRMSFDLASSPFLSDSRYSPRYDDENIRLIWNSKTGELVPDIYFDETNQVWMVWVCTANKYLPSPEYQNKETRQQ